MAYPCMTRAAWCTSVFVCNTYKSALAYRQSVFSCRRVRLVLIEGHRGARSRSAPRLGPVGLSRPFLHQHGKNQHATGRCNAAGASPGARAIAGARAIGGAGAITEGEAHRTESNSNRSVLKNGARVLKCGPLWSTFIRCEDEYGGAALNVW